MKRFTIVLSMVICGLLSVAGAEIPPFYPPAKPVRVEPVLKPSEVAVTLPGGARVEPGLFRRTKSLNGVWKFSGPEKSDRPFSEDPRGFEAPEFDDSAWDRIDVPLNWFRKYKNLYDRKNCYVQGYYRNSFELTGEELRNDRVLLHFKFIGYEAILWINGRRAGTHHGDFVPWTIDITDFVKPGRNQMTMQVFTDFGPSLGSVEKAARTYGAQWDASNIKGGIWGDVELSLEPPVRFSQLYTVPNLSNDTLLVRARVLNTTGKPQTAVFRVAVSSARKAEADKLNSVSDPVPVTLAPGENLVENIVKLNNPERWSPESPYLYYATAMLEEKGETISARTVRFGFREFRIRDGKFHLNGERIYLFGENLPATAGGNPGQTSQQDAAHGRDRLIGFKSLGYNMIRNAHMPYMEEMLDAADEIGIMIYNEWSWCFTSLIEPEEFNRRNTKEFLAWLDRDFNHPSVAMWSCGNEVRHGSKPELRAQLDRQVELVREHDLQRRPAGSFSGSACWRAYGTEPLITDFLDHHSYIGNGEAPWTRWFDNFDGYYNGSLKTYAPQGGPLGMPYIIWECVGFSWGRLSDPKFKPNDSESYAEYVARPTSWGNPNGVGYIGSIGLAAALDPERGMNYAKSLYGKRILEILRQDARVDGFAPWFYGSSLDAAALWTQPVLVGVRNSRGIPPRNLFGGKPAELEGYVVNSTAKPFSGGKAEIRLQLSPDRAIPVATVSVGEVKPFELKSFPLKVTIPAEATGNVQLRIELFRDGRSVSRNFYPVFVGDPAVLDSPIPAAAGTTVALLNVGSREDVERTGKIMNRCGIRYEVVDANSIPAGYRVAVIPAAQANPGKLKFNPEAAFDWIEKTGGFLLILEQRESSGSLLAGTSLEQAPNTLTDLVHPAHPIFKGLEPSNFDTWENPESGYSIRVTLRPFLKNALAARGHMIGGVGIDNAIIEATHGKGRILWSQLDAVHLHESDSVAALYLRNLFEYALSGKWYAKTLPLDLTQGRAGMVDPDTLVPINLAPHANRGFRDEHENDGEGGWTDQGVNDFRNMPLGSQTAGGVRFEIIDPAQNGGKSCIVLRGSERPAFPAEATGIAVNGTFSRLFFLHTAAWSGGEVGVYRIHYGDGTSVDFPLRDGANIGDWWLTSFLTEAPPGIMRENPTKPQVGTYVATWENPFPEKEIRSLDFLSSSSKLLRRIDYHPGRSAVPILVAVTGEKLNPSRIAIDESVRPASGGYGGKVQTVRTELPGGESGPAWSIDFPAFESGKEPPHALFRFAVSGRKLADYRYLTLWVRPETPGAIDFELPEANWKQTLSRTEELSGTSWRKIRIPLTDMGKEKLVKAGQELRGELFLFNGRNRKFQFPRKPVRFLVTGLALE